MIDQSELKGLDSGRQTYTTALNVLLELIPSAHSDTESFILYFIFLSLSYAAFGLKFIWKAFISYFSYQNYNNACMNKSLTTFLTTLSTNSVCLESENDVVFINNNFLYKFLAVAHHVK